jgi:glyoxylase-like metal-dependent hydrolase (beta-lactamase superfamily II)/8-oxo-dGTP pyrophosphatase MutT (NUDIX family)
VVLVRQGEPGPELLFVKRPENMRAFAGFHAFPGGTLDPEDSEVPKGSTNLTLEETAERLGADAGGHEAMSFYVCCLRELFEEVGLLFVVKGGVAYLPDPAERESVRTELGNGRPLAAIVMDRGWQLDVDSLRFRARWLAPEAIPVRFDVRVFVAEFRGEIVPNPDEVDAVDWMGTTEAMMASEAGTVLLAPPTMATIDNLVGFDSVEALLAGKHEGGTRAMEQHSPLIRRLVAPNPSILTGPGTNSYLIGTTELIVIDPGTLDKEHLGRLIGAGRIKTVVVTHHHVDHASGSLELADFVGAEIAASEKFWDIAHLSKDGRRLSEGDIVEADGVSLEVLETPGHASDHISLWMEAEKALFAGDLILGQGTTVISPPDGNLTDYLASLEKVKALGAEVIYPAHFDPRTDVSEWIDYYISHRHDREAEVIDAIRSGASTISQVTAVVYSSYPSALHPVAERSVLAHLEKLDNEGLVRHEGEQWSLRNPQVGE